MSLKARWRKFVKDFGGKALWTLEKIMGRYSRIGDAPFHDPQVFPWAKTLEDNWQAMRDEIREVLKHRESLPNFQDISADQKSITNDDDWKTFFLYGFGFRSERSCARCPQTAALIEQIPGMKTAFFSILSPHKHIPAHRGPYKGLVRYHLGLIVPEPAERCRIRVADQYAHWQPGMSLVFDDTYDHEVWNDTDGERVILFMDILRPLPPLVDLLNRLIIKIVAMSPYIQDAKKNQEAWETRLEQVAVG